MDCMTGPWEEPFSTPPGIILVWDRPHLSPKRTKDIPCVTNSWGAPLAYYFSESPDPRCIICCIVAKCLLRRFVMALTFNQLWSPKICAPVAARQQGIKKSIWSLLTLLSNQGNSQAQIMEGCKWHAFFCSFFLGGRIHWVATAVVQHKFVQEMHNIHHSYLKAVIYCSYAFVFSQSHFWGQNFFITWALSHLVQEHLTRERSFCLWQNLFSVCPQKCYNAGQHAVNARQQKPVVSLQMKLFLRRSDNWLDLKDLHSIMERPPPPYYSSNLANDLLIICDQFHQGPLQHEMTPPTGLQNNRIDTAAVPCVAKHEACSNGRRTSKQTRRSRRDRCSLSESGLASQSVPTFRISTRQNHRQDTGSPRRPTAGEQLLFKSVTHFSIIDEVWC